MSDFSLVPVDHQPDFTEVSLVPVDHDPFGSDGMFQSAGTQSENRPRSFATGAASPAVSAPVLDAPPSFVESNNSALVDAGVPSRVGAENPTVAPISSAPPSSASWAWGDIGAAMPETYGGNAPVRDPLTRALISAATLPQRAINASKEDVEHFGEDGYVPKSIDPALETAMTIMGTGGFAGAALRRAGTGLAEAGALRGGPDSLVSRSASIYDPPAKPPRPFEADYPSGASHDVAGKLTKDIDGRDITARIVVGRRALGGADEALTPAQLDAAATEILGGSPSQVPTSALPRNTVGAYRDARGPDGPERRIDILGNLEPVAKNRVTSHEFGHAVDVLVGTIQAKGLSGELRDVYNSLNNPTRNAAGTDAATFNGTGRTRPWSPKQSGYKGDDVEREYVAEAIRAYMTDPNYLKTVAPRTAATIRKFILDSERGYVTGMVFGGVVKN